jgi:predicted aspartyl protease
MGLAALLLSGGAWAQQCQLKQIASLDMQVTANNRILIPVSIDDKPSLLMVDTGSPLGVLDAAAADRLNIKAYSTARARGPEFLEESGERVREFATVPSLKIGPEEAVRIQFLVDKFDGDFPSGFAGTLGSEVLVNFDVDVDFSANKFNLFSQDHCPGKVVYWAKSYTDADARIDKHGDIAVTMSLDGRDVDAIVETGASVTTLNATDAKQIFGIDAESPGAEPVRSGDVPGAFRYRFKSLTLSGIAMPNPTILVLPDMVAAAARRELTGEKLQGYQGFEATTHMPKLVLGADALRHLHIYIAYGEKKIYATAADAH